MTLTTKLYDLILQKSTLLLENPTLLGTLPPDAPNLNIIFSSTYINSISPYFDTVNVYSIFAEASARPEQNCWQINTDPGPSGLVHSKTLELIKYEFTQNGTPAGSATLLGPMLIQDTQGIYNIVEIDGLLAQEETSFFDYLNAPTSTALVITNTEHTYQEVFDSSNLVCSMVSGFGFGAIAGLNTLIWEQLNNYFERNYFDSFGPNFAKAAILYGSQFAGNSAIYLCMLPYLTPETLLLALQSGATRTMITASVDLLTFLSKKGPLRNSPTAQTVLQTVSDVTTTTTISGFIQGPYNALATVGGFFAAKALWAVGRSCLSNKTEVEVELPKPTGKRAAH